MIIKDLTSGEVIASEAFYGGLTGLMFKKLRSGEACVLINPLNDKLNAGIHTFFVPQELDVIWVNDSGVVVDVKHCKKWRFYWPSSKARMIIEVLRASRVSVGDEITFLS